MSYPTGIIFSQLHADTYTRSTRLAMSPVFHDSNTRVREAARWPMAPMYAIVVKVSFFAGSDLFSKLGELRIANLHCTL